MKTLREIYDNHTGLLTSKYDHYLDVYDRLFARFLGRKINLVEVGVASGGSLQVWDKYFNKENLFATIFGIDMSCKEYLGFNEISPTIQTFEANQQDGEFWDKFLSTYGPIDIFIDDGGHLPIEQKKTFECVLPHMREDGVYIIEDIQLSYSQPGSFVNYCRDFIDEVNASFITGSIPTEITRRVMSICFYNNLIVFELGDATKLHSATRKGTASVRSK